MAEAPSKLWIAESSKPIDLAKAARLSGLGAILGFVMIRTCGLKSIICSGVLEPVAVVFELAVVSTGTAVCAELDKFVGSRITAAAVALTAGRGAGKLSVV